MLDEIDKIDEIDGNGLNGSHRKIGFIDGSGLAWAPVRVFEAIVNLVNHVNLVLSNDGVRLGWFGIMGGEVAKIRFFVLNKH